MEASDEDAASDEDVSDEDGEVDPEGEQADEEGEQADAEAECDGPLEPVMARTDYSFRNRVDKRHHNEASPFESLEIDMINSFTLDGMHTIYLGVVRRFLRFVKGSDRGHFKTQATKRIAISSILTSGKPLNFGRVCCMVVIMLLPCPKLTYHQF